MNRLGTVRSIVGSERGTALVVTLLVLVILTAFGLTLVGLGTTEVAISSNWRDYTKDFYAAEAAVENGVVALRNLLGTNVTGTQPPLSSGQLATISGTGNAPTFSSISGITFNTYSINTASPTYATTFATGPYAGLFGNVTPHAVTAQVTGQAGTGANLTRILEFTTVPLFQFGVFYGQGVDLEIAPGAPMDFNGRIHSNSDIYIGTQAGSPGLQIESYMTTAGGIYRTLKRANAPNCSPCTGGQLPYPPNSYSGLYSDPQIKDAGGTYHALNFDSKYQAGSTQCCSSSAWASQSDFASQATSTFGGQVKTGSMGVGQITPPIPSLFNNPSNPDVVAHGLIETPAVGDSTQLAAAKLYSQASLVISVNSSGVYTFKNKTGTTLTLPGGMAGLVTQRSFYDSRQGATVTSYDVDVTKLTSTNLTTLLGSSGTNAWNGMMYVSSTDTTGYPAVRLVNGTQLPTNGLTVVSQNPVYVKGDYNTGAGSVPGLATSKVAAALLGDAITVLSNNWSDSNASNSSSALSSRIANDTTVNAAFATGPSVESSQSNAGNGQLENVIRFLEDWSGGKNFTYKGSIIALWHSTQATANWQNTGVYYNAPNRHWSYDTLFNTTPPPGTPQGVILSKGRWYQQ
jgi:Tfp pilus assembly protein PilX